jgi:hypothetical protein
MSWCLAHPPSDDTVMLAYHLAIAVQNMYRHYYSRFSRNMEGKVVSSWLCSSSSSCLPWLKSIALQAFSGPSEAFEGVPSCNHPGSSWRPSASINKISLLSSECSCWTGLSSSGLHHISRRILFVCCLEKLPRVDWWVSMTG